MNLIKYYKSSLWLKIIVLNILILTPIIVAFELFAGSWISGNEKNMVCRYVLCDIDITYNNSGTLTRYTKDEYGFRGRTKPYDNVDMVIVGGSTSDQRYIDNAKTWDQKLENLFHENGQHIDIINAGIDGQTTYGHLWNFKHWFPLVSNFKPKYIAFFIGVNDAYPRSNNEHFDNLQKDKNFKKQILDAIKTRSAIYQLYKTVKGTIEAKQAKVGHDTVSVSIKHRIETPFAPNKSDWKTYKDHIINHQLKTRLARLTQATKELGAIPIFITQRSYRWKSEGQKIIGFSKPTQKSKNHYINYNGKTFYWDEASIGYAETLAAQAIMESCKTYSLLCVDAFSITNLTHEDTYDLIHLNNQGTEKMAQFLYNALKDRLVFSNTTPEFTSFLKQKSLVVIRNRYKINCGYTGYGNKRTII